MEKKTVNVKELAKRLQSASAKEITLKDAEAEIKLISKLCAEAVAAGETVRLPEFGLEKAERAERTTRNPRTGEQMTVPKRNIAKLRTYSSFKALLNPAEPEPQPAAKKANGKGKKKKKK